jgi:putative ABC transport system permease protein
MRVIGANPGKLFSLIILEGLWVAVLGFLIGILISHLVLRLAAEHHI